MSHGSILMFEQMITFLSENLCTTAGSSISILLCSLISLPPQVQHAVSPDIRPSSEDTGTRIKSLWVWIPVLAVGPFLLSLVLGMVGNCVVFWMLRKFNQLLCCRMCTPPPAPPINMSVPTWYQHSMGSNRQVRMRKTISWRLMRNAIIIRILTLALWDDTPPDNT